MVQIENKEQLEEIIKNNNIVLMDFYADWCAPCKSLLPVVESISMEMTDILFCKINVDQCSELAKEYNVRSIPSLKIIKSGNEIASLLGAKTSGSLVSWINEELGR
jgi:thioredoxin 1